MKSRLSFDCSPQTTFQLFLQIISIIWCIAASPRSQAFLFGARYGILKRTSTLRTMASSAAITNSKVKHAPDSMLPDWMKAERTRALTTILTDDDKKKKSSKKSSPSSVIYWMQRDMRTRDNWALLWAACMANERKVPLRVVYALPPPPATQEEGEDDDEQHPLAPTLAEMPMTARHGQFLLGGLELVHKELEQLGISLDILQPPSHEQVGHVVCEAMGDAQVVVGDFSPLRQPRQWMELQAAPILEKAKIPFYQVDAHNIVPVWIAGEDKRQVGARTLRPRIHRVIQEYLQTFPTLDEVYKAQDTTLELPAFERKAYESFLQMDESVPAVSWAKPGFEAGMKQYDFFVKNGLKKYDELRNDPNQKNICSNLSPWINHGHISFQRLTMDVKKLNKYANGTSAFVEEGVIRRELSDNFCYHTPNEYDTLEAALGWAQETLQVHSSDEREWMYSLQQLEQAKTHDDLWNAAQLQLVREGGMHGFMRMYWAKKILEWTVSPLFALRAAQYFNDKFALDGKDPNGFVGVGWSIMGIHDQGWKEREVFGKIRFMNYAGCKRKFDVAGFVARYKGAEENAIAAGGQPASADKKKRAAKSTKAKPSKKQKA